ncbi:hypothetical protein [Zavarzinella formosa]|uniref:hypothetical protein n=1 Tax=Zavarzinella formosa TaxID=360055 RepID=UPI0003095DB0|nr:hypothetical protein [Zavarzinella formosa]
MRFSILLLLTASIVFAAPIPKDKPILYFPTKVGDKRVYVGHGRGPDGASGGEIIEIVTAVEVEDGKFVVSLSKDFNGEQGGKFKCHVSTNGLFQTDPDSQDHGRPILKLPATKGDTWEVVDSPGRKTVYVVAGEEEVVVPAGKFKAIRIDSSIESKKFPQKESNWYVPGIGCVKHQCSIGPGEVTLLLKTFTPGK